MTSPDKTLAAQRKSVLNHDMKHHARPIHFPACFMFACMENILLCMALVFGSIPVFAGGGAVVVSTPWMVGSVTNVPPGLTNVAAIAAGLDDAIALRSDGSVVAWGENDYGITNVPGTLSNVVAVSSGWFFHMALRSDRTVVTWGHPSTTVPPGLSNVVAIAAGGHQFCLALRADKTVVGWGWNGSGQTDVPAGLTNIIAIAAGLDHSLALRQGGTVAAWGDNSYGEASVPESLTNVVAIAAGWSQSYALRADGSVVAWGMNATNIPTDLTNVVAIAGGWDAGKEILFNDGSLMWNWANLSNVTAIARGHFFALAITNSGGPSLGCANPIVGSSWVNGCFESSVLGLHGRVYGLQYKNSLEDSRWIPLPLAAGEGRIQQLKDLNAVVPQRFYRVLRW